MDILAVPGINNTAATFDGFCRNMPAHHRVIATNCPALDTVGAIAEALLAETSGRSVVLGHSFGGYVALAMLAAAPERIAGVVLVNSNDWADSDAAAAGRLNKAKCAEAGEYAVLAAAASARAYHPDNVGRADLMEERAAGLIGYGAERYAAHMRASATRPDSGALLKATEAALLVVSADHDVVIPTEKQTEMAKRIGAEQAVLAGAGHMLPVEQPKALARAVANWLDAAFSKNKGQ
ncbi:alpha/beta hydrolase [Marinovum sp.]|uniref:alpha/beta fold hydrolase n=1 Tax=Marinovum sp. TaxID=2024839 RepID=UPI002B26A5F3|nr:alpha/beta hydrolase [Marinovum sp.]